MPRPRPASVTAGRAAPFRVAPWQETTRPGIASAAASAPPPPANDVPEDENNAMVAYDGGPALDDPPGVDYGDSDDASLNPGRAYAGAGYLAYLPDDGTVVGHLIDSESLAVVSVSGSEIPAPPTVDACAAGGGDRLLALTLYEPGSDDQPPVVLAVATGGDIARVTAPAADPRPGPEARRALRAAGAPPPPGRPPTLTFNPTSLLAGADADAYLARVPRGAVGKGAIVNLGSFSATGFRAPSPNAPPTASPAPREVLYDSDLDG